MGAPTVARTRLSLERLVEGARGDRWTLVSNGGLGPAGTARPASMQAAVVSRALDKACVVGWKSIEVEVEQRRFTIDGTT